MQFSLFPGGKQESALPERFSLTILHTNDFHGEDFASMARIAAIVNKARAAEKNVLYLDAGDTFARGKYHEVFYGELEFAILNKIGCDALTLGNNEFKATEDRTAQKYLFERIDQADFPVLCANIRTVGDQTNLKNVKPYTVIVINGVRIGIIGVSAKRISEYPQAEGFIVEDPVVAATKLFPEVRAASDITIALTHIGLDADKALAKALPGLSAIVGGDSHTILDEPFEANSVPIVQAGSSGYFLGRIDLFFELEKGALVLKKYSGILIKIDGTLPGDPGVLEVIRAYMSSIEKEAA